MNRRFAILFGCLFLCIGQADAQEFSDSPAPTLMSPEGEGDSSSAAPILGMDNGLSNSPYWMNDANGGCQACEQPKNCTTCLFNNGEPFRIRDALLGEDSLIDFGGFTQLGLHTRSNGIFNNQPDRINLHQQWLYAEKIADGSNGFGLGGRIDAIYGIDGANTQSFGNNPGNFDFLNGFGTDPREAFAIPQLYGEVAYGNTAVKIGHFYTILGYETVPATGNFFYSHAYTFNFSEPFTHTGALATTSLMDGDLTLYNGFSLGIDTGFDQVRNAGNYLGGFSYQLRDNMTVGYTTAVGDLGAVGRGFYGTGLINMTFLDDKLNWVIQNDVARTDVGFNNGGGNFDSVGLVNYLFYDLSDCYKLGNRFEWYHVDGVDYYESTVGMNIIPHANLRIRPEFRYQWSPQGKQFNPIGVPVDLGIFGIDMILTY